MRPRGGCRSRGGPTITAGLRAARRHLAPVVCSSRTRCTPRPAHHVLGNRVHVAREARGRAGNGLQRAGRACRVFPMPPHPRRIARRTHRRRAEERSGRCPSSSAPHPDAQRTRRRPDSLGLLVPFYLNRAFLGLCMAPLFSDAATDAISPSAPLCIAGLLGSAAALARCF